MALWKNAPPGRIVRAAVLGLYFVAVAAQDLTGGRGAIWIGLLFLALAALLCLWKRPRALAGWMAFLASTLVFAVSLLSEAPLPSQIGVGLFVFALSVLGLAHRSQPVLSYLFLCRFPLLLALLFVGIPWLAIGPAAPMLGNLFVLEPAHLGLVSALAVLASWVLLITVRLIVCHAPECRVDPLSTELPAWAVWKGSQPKPRETALWLYALLALPVIAVAFLESRETGAPAWLQGLAVLGGVLVARGVFAVGHLLSERLLRGKRAAERSRARPQDRVTDWLRAESQHQGTRPSARIVLGFSLATFLLYVGGYFVLHPAGSFHWQGFVYLVVVSVLVGLLIEHLLFWVASGLVVGLYSAGWYFVGGPGGKVLEVPALAYVLVLTILMGWLLALVSFYLDRHRIPVLPVLLVLPLALYFIVDIDHYYRLVQRPASAPMEAADTPGDVAAGELRLAGAGSLPGRDPADEGASGISEAEEREILRAMEARLRVWRERHPEKEPVMVLVSASGGGITSSLWTAHVLSTLQERCPQVIDATHLISAVSGGGVGAMYFLDAYDRGEGFDQVVRKAGESSLSASAWGLAYPDFWRSFSLRHPWDRMLDRAWAMETAWERILARDEVPTLADWGDRARAGELPVMLFNATISETGDRFLMPTLELRSIRPAAGEDDRIARSKTVTGLYADHSMSVVTAARLSATFPFVSPIARPMIETADGKEFHIADGGYYDNFGVVSLVEWLLEVFEHGRPVEVVILEISAYPSRPEQPKARRRAGWLYASAGPLTTMLQVRTSSQVARNDLDFELVEQLGGERFPIERIPFSLELEDAPISWQLSEHQKQEITRDDLSAQMDALNRILPGACAPAETSEAVMASRTLD